MTILIIDDDPEDTTLFCEALAELDPTATCIVAHSYEEIRDSTETIKKADVILIDGQMYPTGGKACLQHLVKIVDRSRTKIIIHSGSVSPNEKKELQEIGAHAIVVKTGNFENLKSNISNILASRFDTIQ